MKITTNVTSKRQRARYIYTKIKKIAKRFYIQNARLLAKSKTISVTCLYTKITKLWVTQFIIEFLNLAEGGAFLYAKKNALCVIFLYTKDNELFITFLYTKIPTLCVTFLYAKKTLCVTFLYLKIIV